MIEFGYFTLYLAICFRADTLFLWIPGWQASNVMTYIAPAMSVATVQPIINNLFYGFNDDWRVQLFDFCNDVPQCEVDHSLPSIFLICICCLLNSRAGEIDESTSCCVHHRLEMYRMKIRSFLRIRVSLLIRNRNNVIAYLFNNVLEQRLWWLLCSLLAALTDCPWIPKPLGNR